VPLRQAKRVLRKIVPASIVSYWRHAHAPPVIDFSGDFPSWESAQKECMGGWDAPNILAKVRASALKVKRGEASFERDSVVFEYPDHRWPLAACLLYAAMKRSGDRFHVADFGGSVGSTYYQHRDVLNAIPALMWSVIEQPHFVACGKAEFEDEVLKFYDTITQVATRGRIDLVLFSGALQCLPNPFDFLAICADMGVPHILIDRHPETDAEEDHIEIQHVREPIYKANSPHRTFAKARFEKFMESIGYQMVFSFQGFDGPHYRGFLFSRS
jgi:putative methyltransferase (TIGR04325 family)